MRLIAVFIELLLPLIIIGCIIGAFQKYIRFNSSYKEWKNEKEKLKANYTTLPFSNLQQYWKEFSSLFKKHMPSNAKIHFEAISENIEGLAVKAQAENWEDSKNRPAEIRPLYDIVYRHVPDMVEEMIEMPSKIAQNTLNHEGKNALQLFEENMALLAKSSEEIAQAAFKDNLKELSVHKEYLKNKFGS